MKAWLVSILILFIVSASAIVGVPAAAECTEPIPALYQRISPSVVFISAVSIDPFRVTNRVSSSIGSGFIIGTEGLVLTNSPVVFGSRALSVTLDDGSTAPAQLLGADPILDLAVLRTPSLPKGHPIATLGDSDAVKVGEEVLAIGNPLGLEHTITRGTISGVNRVLPTSPMSMKDGRVIRPWLGIAGKLIGKEDEAVLTIPLVDGFLVETIEPGSPAEKAGVQGGQLPINIAGEELLLGGDIVTTANGEPLNDPEKFARFVQSLKVGDRVHLVIFREGKTRKFEFVLPERPILPGDLTPCDRRVLPSMEGPGITFRAHH